MIHPIDGRLLQLHKKIGDAKLLLHLGRYSVGQSQEALHNLMEGVGSETIAAGRLSIELNNRGAYLLTLLDQEYPSCFRALERDAPPFLYVIGDVQRIQARSIAIIGTRWPTRFGREAAQRVAKASVAAGYAVVSGNAPGVDSAAHTAALTGPSGETLVFPPTPLDQYKPNFRGGSPEQITVVSPFAPGIATAPWMFLRRNTLVAAQCLAAFVAETGTRGGTVDTIKKLGKSKRGLLATALPADAKFVRAHTLLAAGGVELLDVLGPESKWVPCLVDAAENTLRHPPVSIPVLNDFFPEDFTQ